MDKKNGAPESSENGVELKSIDLERKGSEAVQLESISPKEDRENLDVYSTVVSGAIAIFRFVKTLNLELITFLYMAGYILRANTAMTILMDKVCRVNLQYQDDVCSNLKDHEAQKTLVETMANNYNLGHTLIAMLPSSILSCFVGPWSDRYGRRLPMIVGLVGIILDDFCSTIWAHFPQAGAGFYFIPPMFSGFSGGFISALTIIYSYASDTTPAKHRTVKYAILEAALGFSIPIGAYSGGIIYKYYGFMPVFATSFSFHALDLIVVFFILKETRGIASTDGWKEKARVFISSRNFLEGFRVTKKTRPHKGRIQLWLLFLAMSMTILIQVGAGSIAYLFAHHHYSWGNTKYSTISSIFSVMTVVAMMIAVPIFTKVLNLSDPMLGMIGGVSLLGKVVCFCMASKESLYFLGCLMGLLSNTPNLAGRARISKIIPKEDLGKVFAFLSTVESLLPIVSSIAISQLFNATIGMMPDPTYSLFVICAAVMLGIYIWLYFLPKVNYEEMREQEEQQESAENVPADVIGVEK